MINKLRRDDRGSVSLEAAVVAPGLFLLLALAIIAGRTSLAAGAVEQAARDAARQASIARDAGTARQRAVPTARATLAAQGLQCGRLSVDLDTSGFAVPVGQPAQVTATVVCTVALADVAIPGTPGSKTLTARFSSPLDTFRERR